MAADQWATITTDLRAKGEEVKPVQSRSYKKIRPGIVMENAKIMPGPIRGYAPEVEQMSVMKPLDEPGCKKRLNQEGRCVTMMIQGDRADVGSMKSDEDHEKRVLRDTQRGTN